MDNHQRPTQVYTLSDQTPASGRAANAPLARFGEGPGVRAVCG